MAILKGISPLLSPDLLHILAQMGHGDDIVLADANFPAVSVGKRVIRADAISVPPLLEAILQLFPLDSFVEEPAAVMRRVDKPDEPAPIWTEFQRILDSAERSHVGIERVERFAFYERSRAAFAIVSTGERALYGNLILKKGIIPPNDY